MSTRTAEQKARYAARERERRAAAPKLPSTPEYRARKANNARKWRAANVEHCQEYWRKWYESRSHGPMPDGYYAAHHRLRSTRGRAAEYPCADCGGEAKEWAFDEPKGFSDDPSRYRPLCRPCHWKADRECA